MNMQYKRPYICNNQIRNNQPWRYNKNGRRFNVPYHPMHAHSFSVFEPTFNMNAPYFGSRNGYSSYYIKRNVPHRNMTWRNFANPQGPIY